MHLTTYLVFLVLQNHLKKGEWTILLLVFEAAILRDRCLAKWLIELLSYASILHEHPGTATPV
jgi:hypothetical protein